MSIAVRDTLIKTTGECLGPELTAYLNYELGHRSMVWFTSDTDPWDGQVVWIDKPYSELKRREAKYMSTEFTIYKEPEIKIEVSERSSKFSIGLSTGAVSVWTVDMDAEELVRAAVKLIQPTLYNVEDPRAFFES